MMIQRMNILVGFLVAVFLQLSIDANLNQAHARYKCSKRAVKMGKGRCHEGRKYRYCRHVWGRYRMSKCGPVKGAKKVTKKRVQKKLKKTITAKKSSVRATYSNGVLYKRKYCPALSKSETKRVVGKRYKRRRVVKVRGEVIAQRFKRLCKIDNSIKLCFKHTSPRGWKCVNNKYFTRFIDVKKKKVIVEKKKSVIKKEEQAKAIIQAELKQRARLRESEKEKLNKEKELKRLADLAAQKQAAEKRAAKEKAAKEKQLAALKAQKLAKLKADKLLKEQQEKRKREEALEQERVEQERLRLAEEKNQQALKEVEEEALSEKELLDEEFADRESLEKTPMESGDQQEEQIQEKRVQEMEEAKRISLLLRKIKPLMEYVSVKTKTGKVKDVNHILISDDNIRAYYEDMDSKFISKLGDAVTTYVQLAVENNLDLGVSHVKGLKKQTSKEYYEERYGKGKTVELYLGQDNESLVSLREQKAWLSVEGYIDIKVNLVEAMLDLKEYADSSEEDQEKLYFNDWREFVFYTQLDFIALQSPELSKIAKKIFK